MSTHGGGTRGRSDSTEARVESHLRSMFSVPVAVAIARESGALWQETTRTGTEHGAILSRQGQVLQRAQGARGHISFGSWRDSPGHIVLHTHPDNGALDEGDVKTASDLRTAAEVIVTRDYLYVIQPDRSGSSGGRWPSIATWREAFYPILERHLASAYARVHPQIQSGQVSRANAMPQAWHEAWTQVAAETGLRYQRIHR